MINLSVNVNKVATLRNSRGGSVPSVLDAVEVCLAAGVPGITVHPREDERHIRPGDVRDIAALLARPDGTRRAEFNMEGDPRPSFLDLVLEVHADQCTLVPVAPGEITSHAGWPPWTPKDHLTAVVRRLKDAGIRVSIFVDPELEAISWAAGIGADRVELYTEPFAKAFAAGGETSRRIFATYVDAAARAHGSGLGINAGHDLDLDNLILFRTLPHLDEVSIGHALISHALFVGLDRAVRDYLAMIVPAP